MRDEEITIVDLADVPPAAYKVQRRTEERLELIQKLPEGKAAKLTLPNRSEAIRLRNSFRTMAHRYWGPNVLHTRVVDRPDGKSELFLWRNAEK